MILGLDLSSANSGWAIIDYNENLIAYGNFKSKTKWTPFEKIAFMFRSFQDIIIKYDISFISIEDQFCGKNVKTLKLLSRIAGAVIALATVHELPIDMYPPTEVKKIFTGIGNASKDLVMEKVLEKYILEAYDDNTTDAIAIAITALRINGGKINEDHDSKLKT